MRRRAWAQCPPRSQDCQQRCSQGSELAKRYKPEAATKSGAGNELLQTVNHFIAVNDATWRVRKAKASIVKVKHCHKVLKEEASQHPILIWVLCRLRCLTRHWCLTRQWWLAKGRVTKDSSASLIAGATMAASEEVMKDLTHCLKSSWLCRFTATLLRTLDLTLLYDHGLLASDAVWERHFIKDNILTTRSQSRLLERHRRNYLCT
mmetsp:Transcript_115413/g.230138  ORF Transcript_115413/g.230138 Transcript_115413/m.230138 type:complete len:206 (-) Transcript_115413:579-1196(-)